MQGLERGATLGKYEILRKVATGGMAELYLARVRGTAGFEKLVGLKRILPSVAADPAFVEMFLAEARLAATLQHPNIADVYDVGEADGQYFFTMEYVHGEDARSLKVTTRKRGERIPLPIALAIVHGTASALDYAHAKTGPDGALGLVHRDVSTSNIMISYDGAVKLVDFGIARATARESNTRTGSLKGKIPYMSPEQCQNRPLDRRSDLFSLGTVMYELTVGRRPFRGDSDFAIMEQIVHLGAPPPRAVDPAYPAELEAIVTRLMARDLAARYQTAEQLLADLEEFQGANQLWVSQKPINRYMRGLFGDKIAAWEAAEQQGVTLGQHVAETITAESRRSEPGTPGSGFSGIEPLRSAQISAPVVDSSAPAYPDVRRRGARALVIGGTCLLVLGGAAAVMFAMRDDSRPQAAHDTGSKPGDRAPAPGPQEPVVAPAPAPNSQEPVAAPAPSPQEPAAAPVPAPADSVTAPDPSKPAPPTVDPPASRPPVVRPVHPTRPPSKAAAPKKSPAKPDRPDKPDKEPTWDPNSPFLPPS